MEVQQRGEGVVLLPETQEEGVVGGRESGGGESGGGQSGGGESGAGEPEEGCWGEDAWDRPPGVLHLLQEPSVSGAPRASL